MNVFVISFANIGIFICFQEKKSYIYPIINIS